jgi:hypothetical protein
MIQNISFIQKDVYTLYAEVFCTALSPGKVYVVFSALKRRRKVTSDV